MIDQIKAESTAALKAGDRDRVGALRMLIAALQRAEKDAPDGELTQEASEDRRNTVAAGTSQAVPWRPSGTVVVPREGRPAVAARPIGVSISPGATTLARTPLRAPSSATWRHRPMRPAFDAS